MIDQDSIDQKDFSMELSQLAAKLRFLSCGLYHSRNAMDFEPDHLEGVSYILEEAGRDLTTIYEALYGSKDQEVRG